MELQGERLIPASVQTTWSALNDPATLKGCISNCESLERTGDDTLAAVVAMKIGPVSARFKGNLTITNVQAPTGYTIVFEGQGGMAGFGKGSADVALTPTDDGRTTLKYLARATVGGKIAQIGSRLIDSAAAKITNDFFSAFETELEARSAHLAGGNSSEFGTAAGPGGLGDGAGPSGDVGANSPGDASGTPGGTPGTPGHQNFRLADESHSTTTALAAPGAAGPEPPIRSPAPNGRDLAMPRGGAFGLDPAVTRLWALIGAVIVLGGVYFAIR